LLNHKRPKIKKDVMIQAIEDGGINAPDFTSIVKASRVAWIKRLLIPNNAKWKAVLQALIDPISIEHLTQMSLPKSYIDSLPPFYKQIFQSWNEIKEIPITPELYQKEIIWHNRFIETPIENVKKNKVQSLFFRDFYKKGIIRVNQLYNENGKFLDYNSLTSKYEINCNILQFYRLKKCFPNDIIHAALPPGVNDNNIKPIGNMQKVPSKAIYNCFIKKKYVIPTALAKWENKYNIDHDDWKPIFQLPYFSTRETIIQTFQFRIIHRIFPCKRWFYNLGVESTDNCNQCKEVDTIEHSLYHCSTIKPFWGHLERWWNDMSETKVILSEKHVMFGIYYDNKFYSNINYIILCSKMYIYRQKLREDHVVFNNFLKQLKYKLDIEKSICQNQNTIPHFNKKWEQIISIL